MRYDDIHTESNATHPTLFRADSNRSIDTTIRDRETRHIREWVSRTIAPQPVDYTINTTLRDNSNPDPDDVWDME